MRDRIDEWCRRNSENPVFSSFTLDIAPSTSHTSSSSSHASYIASSNLEDRISALEKEIIALRNERTTYIHPVEPAPRVISSPVTPSSSHHLDHSTSHSNFVMSPFDPVDHPVSTSTSYTTPAFSPRTSNSTSIGILSSTAAHPSTSIPSSNISNTPRNSTSASFWQRDILEFPSSPSTAYLPPKEPNFGTTPKKPRQKSSYHSPAPIETSTIAQDIFDRSTSVPTITLTTEELYSLSPEVRTKLRDHISLRHPPPSPIPSPNILARSTLDPDHDETSISPLDTSTLRPEKPPESLRDRYRSSLLEHPD